MANPDILRQQALLAVRNGNLRGAGLLNDILHDPKLEEKIKAQTRVNIWKANNTKMSNELEPNKPERNDEPIDLASVRRAREAQRKEDKRPRPDEVRKLRESSKVFITSGSTAHAISPADSIDAVAGQPTQQPAIKISVTDIAAEPIPILKPKEEEGVPNPGRRRFMAGVAGGLIAVVDRLAGGPLSQLADTTLEEIRNSGRSQSSGATAPEQTQAPAATSIATQADPVTPTPHEQTTPEPTNKPAVEPTPTMTMEQRAEMLANIPIVLTTSPEAEDGAPFVSELFFRKETVYHPISGEPITAEEAVRQAFLIVFGWAAGIENAHQITKDQLVLELAQRIAESPDSRLHTKTVSFGFNYARNYEEAAIDPMKGVVIAIEPWSLPLPDGYADLYLEPGGDPDYAYKVTSDDDGQTEVHVTFDPEQAQNFDYVPRLPFNDALLLALGEIGYPEEKSIGLERNTALWRYLVETKGGGMGQFSPFINVETQPQGS